MNIFLKILFIYSLETHTERERERGRDTGRRRNRFHAGSLMWDLIPCLLYTSDAADDVSWV